MTHEQRGIIIALVALGLLAGALGSFSYFRTRYQPSEVGSYQGENRLEVPDGVQVHVDSSTLPAGQEKELIVKAPDLQGAESVTLMSPELNLHKSVSAAELRAGVPVKIGASKLGTYHVQATMRNAVLGSARVTVAAAAGGTAAGKDLKYELQAGKLISHAGGGLTLPIFVVSKDKDDTETKVPESATVTIRDSRSNVSLGTGRLLKDSAQSQAVSLTLELDTNYQLVGSIKYDNDSHEYTTPPRDFSYALTDFQLALFVQPAKINVYPTVATPAQFMVYLTSEGTRFYPKKPVAIVASADAPGVRIEPAALSIEPASASAACQVIGTRSQDVKVNFSLGPQTPTPFSVDVIFDSIGWFYWLGVLAGIAGRLLWLVSRASVSYTQLRKKFGELTLLSFLFALVVEVGVGVVGSLVLAAAHLEGWIGRIDLLSQSVDWPAAMFFGVAGGVLGWGSVKLVAKYGLPGVALPD